MATPTTCSNIVRHVLKCCDQSIHTRTACNQKLMNINTTSCWVITHYTLQHPHDSVNDLRSRCNSTLRHTTTIHRPTYSSNDRQYSHMPAGHAESHYCTTDRPSHLCFSAMARKQRPLFLESLLARINLAIRPPTRGHYCEPLLKTYYLITSDLQTCMTAKCKSASQNTGRSLFKCTEQVSIPMIVTFISHTKWKGQQLLCHHMKVEIYGSMLLWLDDRSTVSLLLLTYWSMVKWKWIEMHLLMEIPSTSPIPSPLTLSPSPKSF